MESLDGSEWDVVIAGTGLQESLLALALSRSSKRVLHIDKHDYYGGADASFSLQEAEAWANKTDSTTVFSEKTLVHLPANPEVEPRVNLSFSRAYSLALAPQIIYARTSLLSVLVTSRVDAQLEFLAVGRWWIYRQDVQYDHSRSTSPPGFLVSIPSGREDIFGDTSIEPPARRALMRFLRFIVDYENQSEMWRDYSNYPLSDFLLAKFHLSASVQQPLLALTLLPTTPSKIKTSIALARIARHLNSFGVFGPGFSAVIPKWGGLSEIAQIGCRAGAVGGGVYVLGNGLEEVNTIQSTKEDGSSSALELKLQNGNTVRTHRLVTAHDNIPPDTVQESVGINVTESYCRSVSIISSPLLSLFPPIADGGPSPAVAQVAFPGSISFNAEPRREMPQTIMSIHSADTGECPAGQCVIYGSVACPSEQGFQLLNDCVSNLLRSVEEDIVPKELWRLQYSQSESPGRPTRSSTDGREHVISLPAPSLDLAFDENIMGLVKTVWEEVDGVGAHGFMQFPRRGDTDDVRDEE